MPNKEGGSPVSHDQNFKNLILDYPIQAIKLFSPAEASGLDDSVRIVPLRQEQLKQRLGDRFRELDVPLRVEWPDGRREALLFALEEESDTRRFSIHRLAHYCLDLGELLQTDRVVPVVIFLKSAGREPASLVLGSERHPYLNFTYVRCALSEMKAQDYWNSNNLIARLCLSLMSWSYEQKLEVYARAVRGLLTLEPDPEMQAKYIDFIDIYSALDDNEMQQYSEQYPQENNTMMTLSERLRAEGMEKGMQQGMERAARAILIRQLQRRFGPLSGEVTARVEQADQTTLERWSERILEANSLEEVFSAH